jgi:glycosyltransferase involved in cell wall biosynthesis
MFISVIVPTRNRAGLLHGALCSLKAQTYPPGQFEVIVVDNGSTDNTREVCETCRADLQNFRYVYDPRPGLLVGRHAGLKAADADILTFADDDVEAFPNWLEGVAEAFENDDVVLVGGKSLPKFQKEPPPWIQRLWGKKRGGVRVVFYLSILDMGDEAQEASPYYVFGCNFSIRKSTLIEAGGFHPDAMPPEMVRYRGDGETSVCRFITDHGLKALYHPRASVSHSVPAERMTLDYFCRRAWLQGISDSYTSIRDGRTRLLSYYREMNIVGKRLLSRKPASTFLSHQLRGFLYHQRQVKNDPALYDWVMKSDYFE